MPQRRRSDRFLARLSSHEAIAVVTHHNPDPDAISSGWALTQLLAEKTKATVRLFGGGAVMRAENRRLIELLSPPLELVGDLPSDREWAVVLVDCNPSGENHLAAERTAAIQAVVDHHVADFPRTRGGPFIDLRPTATATASIAVRYLWEQGVKPGTRLATALLYGIRSETRGFEHRYGRADRLAVSRLSQIAHPEWMAEIENAPLPRGYFEDLTLALQRIFVYGSVALGLFPQVSMVESMAEFADLLVRGEGIDCVLCAAAVGEKIYLSIRTNDKGGDAGALCRKFVHNWGRGGGHEYRAGGVIPLPAGTSELTNGFAEKLRRRWLEVSGVDPKVRGQRLVRLRDLLSNL